MTGSALLALIVSRKGTASYALSAITYSPSLARPARRGLAERLDRAERALLALTPPPDRGKRRWTDLEALQGAAEAILRSIVHSAQELSER
jgi:transposase